MPDDFGSPSESIMDSTISETPDNHSSRDQDAPSSLNPDSLPQKHKPAEDAALRVAAEGISVDEPDDALPPLTLDALAPYLQEACARIGWSNLMPVQAHALPYIMARRDIMVQSRTGSGKTGAYLLPLLDMLDPAIPETQSLVLVPTRELALQVEREAKILFGSDGLRVVAVYGGVGYGKQLEELRNGAHLVVGTPGRVLDHLLRRTLNLEHVRSLVFDEADRMLSIGFYPDMKEVQRYLPKKEIVSCLFSATYPPHVMKLAAEFMREPQLLSLSQSQVHVLQTQHMYCVCKTMDKDRCLIRLLEMENPSSAIIFCNTKATVHYVAAVLQGFGYNADELSADLSQSMRERVLGRLRASEVRFLVATDVAARGIDIPELSHVFMYEPPEDREAYIHRAGRTGRAGTAGTVISLVDIMQKIELERIARHYKIAMQVYPTPTDEEVSTVIGAKLNAHLEARFRGYTNLERERVRRFVELSREMAGEDEQNWLLAMLLDACYQQSLGDTVLPMPARRSPGGRSPSPEREREAPRGGRSRRPQTHEDSENSADSAKNEKKTRRRSPQTSRKSSTPKNES